MTLAGGLATEQGLEEVRRKERAGTFFQAWREKRGWADENFMSRLTCLPPSPNIPAHSKGAREGGSPVLRGQVSMPMQARPDLEIRLSRRNQGGMSGELVLPIYKASLRPRMEGQPLSERTNSEPLAIAERGKCRGGYRRYESKSCWRRIDFRHVQR